MKLPVREAIDPTSGVLVEHVEGDGRLILWLPRGNEEESKIWIRDAIVVRAED